MSRVPSDEQSSTTMISLTAIGAARTASTMERMVFRSL
jgi:hypothetical protein